MPETGIDTAVLRQSCMEVLSAVPELNDPYADKLSKQTEELFANQLERVELPCGRMGWQTKPVRYVHSDESEHRLHLAAVDDRSWLKGLFTKILPPTLDTHAVQIIMDGQWHDPVGFFLKTVSGLPVLVMGMHAANDEERGFYDKLVQSIKTGSKIEHPAIIELRETRRREYARRRMEQQRLWGDLQEYTRNQSRRKLGYQPYGTFIK